MVCPYALDSAPSRLALEKAPARFRAAANGVIYRLEGAKRMKKPKPGAAGIAVKRQMAAVRRKKVARAMARLGVRQTVPNGNSYFELDVDQGLLETPDGMCNCAGCRAGREAGSA